MGGKVSEVGTYAVIIGGVMPKSYLGKSWWPRCVGWLYTLRYTRGHMLIYYKCVTQINTWALHYIQEGWTDLIRTFFFFLTACLSGSRRVTWAKSCRAA